VASVSLVEQLTQDMKNAMRNKEKTKLSTIRMVRSAIKKAEIDQKTTLSDDDVMAIMLREIKQRKDAIREYTKAERDDLVAKEQEELEILQTYLPEPLSEAELRELVQQTITQLGASSKKEMGKVMGAVLSQVKGRADGKAVNQLVQELLS
jgi:uncharacterized protein